LALVLTRLAGRIVTSPPAFFVAGVLDLSIYAAGSLRRRMPAREWPTRALRDGARPEGNV
jgi:hypothetical protein